MEKKSMPAAGQIMRLLEKSPSIPIYKEKDKTETILLDSITIQRKIKYLEASINTNSWKPKKKKMMFLEMLSILIIKQGTYICLFLKNWITLLKLSAFKHMTSSKVGRKKAWCDKNKSKEQLIMLVVSHSL